MPHPLIATGSVTFLFFSPSLGRAEISKRNLLFDTKISSHNRKQIVITSNVWYLKRILNILSNKKEGF